MSVEIVSIETIRKQIQGGTRMRVIDVRSPAEYDRVHALGAESIPLDELDAAHLAARQNGSDEAIYFICQSGSRSSKACEKVALAGVARVYSIEGGTAAWEAAGLPVERGVSRVISLERQVRITAGMLILIGVILTLTVHRDFLFLVGFIGAGLVFAGITDFCGMGLLLARMPWNKRGSSTNRAQTSPHGG
jgi:rhodanese-related sulfurtransferase